MIYTMSQTPTETVLVATAATWKAIVGLRKLRTNRQIREATFTITSKITGKSDNEVIRVRLPSDIAEEIVNAARGE